MLFDGKAEEVEHRPVIHRRRRDVVRESRHSFLHQDPKVIAEISADNAETICGSDDECRSDGGAEHAEDGGDDGRDKVEFGLALNGECITVVG